MMIRKTLASKALLLVFVCLSLVSCQSPSEKIKGLFDALPVPLGSELLQEQQGTRQGSQDACFFTFEQRLYGTNQSFELVGAFYADELDAAFWSRDTGDLVGPGTLGWEHNRQEYRLRISADPHLDFPKQVVESAASKYRTIYFIGITHADWVARSRCLSRD